MSSYEIYKPTNLEWLDDLPSHWELVRLKNIVSPREGRSLSGEEELLSVTIHKGIIKRSDYLDDDEENLSRSESLVGYKLVSKGNLVNNIMKMAYRCCGISNYDGMVSPAYSVFEVNSDLVNEKYLHYTLRTDLYLAEFKKRSKGIQESKMRLYDDYFLDIKFPLPPLNEQNLIAKFIDLKVGLIDELINQSENKLSLFQEQKDSTIYKYAIYGSDANTTFKEGDIDSINLVPSHWEKIKIKYLIEDCFGGQWGDEPDDSEDLVQVIRVTEFNYRKFTVSHEIPTLRKLELESDSHKLVKKYDLILEKSGGGEKTPVGRIVMVDVNPSTPTVNSNFTNLIRLDLERVDPLFMTYLLNLYYKNGLSIRNIKQTTGIQNLDVEGLLQEFVYLPPIDEQRLISKKIYEFLDKIDCLVQAENERIGLLKELKESLITDAVTGKVMITKEMV